MNLASKIRLSILILFSSILIACESEQEDTGHPTPTIQAYNGSTSPCALIGTRLQFNHIVISNPTSVPPGYTTPFSYFIQLPHRSIQLVGSSNCLCKVKSYRLFFNTLQAAKDAELVSSTGQSVTRSTAIYDPHAHPSPYYVAVSTRNLASGIYLAFNSFSAPSPQLVHASGYCIVDNIGGTHNFVLSAPMVVPTTEEEGSEEEYNQIFFWPEEAEEIEEIPEFP